jgi:CubicO group peptidase (beta-lactamase class C family)
MKRLPIALLCVVALCAAAPDSTSPQAVLDARTAAVPGSGIVAAVIDHGRVTTYFSGASGTSRTLDAHTLFEIGSITKTFTATALASLVRRGVVHLNDPVSRYLPADVHVPSRDGKAITLLNLATQHSGLPRLATNMTAVDMTNPYYPYTVADLYAFLDTYRLPRDPGASYEYSNLGFGLLGLAVEHASRASSYGSLVEQTIFTPLGMTDSEVADSLISEPRLAVGHDADGNAVHSWEFTDASAGAGAIRSSLTDMVKYLQCNLGRGPLAPTCLFAQQPRNTFTGHRIGLAWYTDDTSGITEHDGATAGFRSTIMMNAARTKGVVVLSSGPAIEDVALHLLDPASPLTAAASTFDVTEQLANEYSGIYRNDADGITYTISHNGSRLYAQITGQPRAEIYPSRWRDHFYYKDVQAYIEFVRQGGAVVGLILRQSGRDIPVYRLDSSGKPMAASLTPAFPPVITLAGKTLQEYAGTYNFFGTNFVVTATDGHLFAQLGSQPAFEIYPSAKDEFYYKVVDAQITFTRTGGKVTGLILHQTGRDMPAPRK